MRCRREMKRFRTRGETVYVACMLAISPRGKRALPCGSIGPYGHSVNVDRTCTLVIFCPLAFERAGVERAVRKAVRVHGESGAAARADSAAVSSAPEFRFIQTGPGPRRVVEAVEGAITSGPIAEARSRGHSVVAVLAGVAGELAPAGGAMAFVDVVSAGGEHWRSMLPRETIGNAGGSILGLDTPAYTSEEKAHWRERTGALLVDTESHAFAAACERFRLPWVVVRAASDRRHESLPAASARWVDAAGETVLNHVLIDLVRAPSLLPALIRLGRRGSVATRMVGARIEAISRAATLAADASTQTEIVRPPITVLPPEVLGAPLLILFGGSFDPPHVAHVRLPMRVREELERRMGCLGKGELIYVPAARSPHKTTGPVASDADRVAMLRLALEGESRASVWTDEMDRTRWHDAEAPIFGPVAGGTGGGERAATPARPPSYTIETVERLLESVERLADTRGGARPVVRLLIGADQAAAFHRWKDARRLMARAEPVVMPRGSDEGRGELGGGADVEGVMAELAATNAWTEEELRAWRGRIVPLGVMEHRATEVRAALAGGSVEGAASAGSGGGGGDATKFVDGKVLGYIRERGLYGGVG